MVVLGGPQQEGSSRIGVQGHALLCGCTQEHQKCAENFRLRDNDWLEARPAGATDHLNPSAGA